MRSWPKAEGYETLVAASQRLGYGRNVLSKIIASGRVANDVIRAPSGGIIVHLVNVQQMTDAVVELTRTSTVRQIMAAYHLGRKAVLSRLREAGLAPPTGRRKWRIRDADVTRIFGDPA